jgi:translocation and assembly module TamB
MAARARFSWQRWATWGGGVVLALAALLYAAWELGALNGAALWVAEEATGYRIACTKIDGDLLSSFTCENLALGDDQGTFLGARALSLEWDPWALIGNKVEARRLTLADATITRVPQSQAPATSQSFLPTTEIAIGALDAKRVTLSLAAAPHACLNLGGKGAIGPEGFDADLTLFRCRPEHGALAFKGTYVDKTGALSLSAHGRDDGALIAALSGMKNAGPTMLALDGAGKLPAFDGHIFLASQNVATIDAAFQAHDFSATRFKARFAIAPQLLPDWAPKGSGTLDGDVARDVGASLDIRSLALTWAGVKAEGKLHLASDGAIAGDVALESETAVTLSGISIGAVTAGAKLGGTKTAPELRGAATLSNLAQGSNHIEAVDLRYAVAAAARNTFDASLVGHARGALLPAGGLLGSAFSFHGTGARDSSGNVTVDAVVDGAASALTAKAQIGAAHGSGRLVLSVPDLSRTDAGFSGRAVAVLDLPRLTLSGSLEGALKVDARDVTATGKGAALGKSPSLTAHVRAQDGTYAFSDIRLETAAASVAGSAKLARTGALEADLHTNRGDLKPLSAMAGHKLNGAFSLTAKLSGSESAPELVLAADAPRLRIDNNIVRSLALKLDARKRKTWAGQLDGNATTPAGTVALAADLATTEEGWSADIAQGQLGPATLTGHLAKAGAQYEGAVMLKGDILEPVGFVLGAPMQGVGTLAVRGAGQSIRLALDLDHVSAAPLKNAKVHADATMEGLAGPMSARLAVRDGANHLAASAVGSLSPVSITLAKFGGGWAGAPFALRGPATFAMKAANFTLDRTTLTISGGTLTLAAHGGGGSLSATAHLADLPLAPLAAVMGGNKAEGKIGLDLSADLAPGRTHATLSVDAKDVMFSHLGKKEKPADLALTAHWDGNLLTAAGRISGLDDKVASLSARLPVVRAANGYLPKLASSGPISGVLTAQMQAGRLMALLPIAEESASGLLTASAEVKGDISNPDLSGRIALSDGSFVDYDTGTRLNKLNASIEAAGGAKAVLKLAATDGNSGIVKADGEFSLSALETGGVGKLAGHLAVSLNNADVLREDLVHAGATGTVSMDLPGDAPPKITGTLTTGTVRVDLGAAIPPAVPEIDVREINGGAPPAPKPSAQPLLFTKAILDIAITMPNRIYVSGHGTDSKWSGNLKVAGTVGSPDISGTLDLVRGQADLVGKTFTLQEGTVRIDPTIPGNADLHIIGQNESSDITVTVTIDGPVTKPKIAWTSSPSLPQSEILSRLFFGTSTPQLTIGQAIQLAQLSGQLGAFGLGGSGGILGFARRVTGLDVLSVDTTSDTTGTETGNTGPTVTAGKYVTDRVYLGVKQGADVSAGTAQVQVKVTRHITLDAEAGANSQGSLGVTWKWDY